MTVHLPLYVSQNDFVRFLTLIYSSFIKNLPVIFTGRSISSPLKGRVKTFFNIFFIIL